LASKYAIVGASLAGATAAATLRQEGFDGEVVLIGAEPQPPYERPPLSKQYLRNEIPFEKTLVRPEGFYQDQRIEVRLGTRATRVDPASQVVHLDDGQQQPYDKLLIATGGRNRQPPIPGLHLEGVYDLRTVNDTDVLRAAIAPGRKAVVVGMGFIGCEVTASLRQTGVDVVTLDPLRTSLFRMLGEEVGQVVAAIHRDHGVDTIFGDGVARFEGHPRLERVVTSAGRHIDCDFAVVGLGIEPVTDLVAGTGVEIDNGVLVDQYCRTAVEGIYAAGDVANHFHPVFGTRVRVEHWQNAIKQGAAAARSMIGKGAPYDEIPWFWSDQYDTNLQYAGFHTPWDRIVIRGSLERRSFLAFYLRGGRVDAVAGLNRGKDIRRSLPLIRSRAEIDPSRLEDDDVDLRSLLSSA
jgi:3-phenylpropionate/trans-cinnamate dioxygenase ferredoxin reductase subunit